jgi:hypothetical protein
VQRRWRSSDARSDDNNKTPSEATETETSWQRTSLRLRSQVAGSVLAAQNLKNKNVKKTLDYEEEHEEKISRLGTSRGVYRFLLFVKLSVRQSLPYTIDVTMKKNLELG